MSDYTVAEVDTAIKNSELRGWDEFAYCEVGHTEAVTLRGEPGEIEVVATDPGGEGHGEHVFVVVRAGDQFFKKTGYYASHCGTDWDGDVREVKPAQKTITVYEAV